MPVEEQLLPHQDLADLYDAAVWVYVCRTWREDEADREAARIHDRLGVTSWPQMFLVDPRDGSVLARPRRTVESLGQAIREAAEAVEPPAEAWADPLRLLHEAREAHARGDDAAARERLSAVLAAAEASGAQGDPLEAGLEARELLRAWAGGKGPALDEGLVDPSPYERARALEALAAQGPAAVTDARRERLEALLHDPREDVVVRIRALACLAPVAPEAVTAKAEALLAVGNDVLAFGVLDVLAEHPRADVSALLARRFASPGPSWNPNVLRGRLARCLEVCGDATAVDALEPLVRTADSRNSTVHAAVRALGGIASRGDEALRRRVAEILLAAVPPACEPEETPGVGERYALLLARLVAEALGRGLEANEPLAVPERWSESDREAFLDAASRRLPPRED